MPPHPPSNFKNKSATEPVASRWHLPRLGDSCCHAQRAPVLPRAAVRAPSAPSPSCCLSRETLESSQGLCGVKSQVSPTPGQEQRAGRAHRGHQEGSGLEGTGRGQGWRAPVVVGFEGSVLVEPQVLGLLVRQLRQVRVERGQVQAGHVLVWGRAQEARPRHRRPQRVSHNPPGTSGW